LHDPVRIESWTQFSSTFGRHVTAGYLAYAVEGFYANGGDVCYVVRVADAEAAAAATLDIRLDDGRTLRLTASSRGQWGNSLQATLNRARSDRLTLILRLASGEQEQWRDLTLDEDDERFVVRVLNGQPTTGEAPTTGALPGSRQKAEEVAAGSKLVRAWVGHRPSTRSASGIALDRTTQTATLAGGEDGVWTRRPEA